jgi:fused signal recognition particle receptor
MFDKLKKAFSGVAIKNIGQKEISEKDFDNNLFDLQLVLLESDVAQEVIDDLSARLKKELLGLKLEKGQKTAEDIIRSKLKNSIAEMFAKAGKTDLIQKIKEKRDARGGPFVIVFLGINGTGKTTTVAKIAYLLRKNGISVVLAAGDTHRAGAIEQLTQHAEKLSLKVISQRYGADPSAVGRDAVDYSRKHYIDAVLIDTAGRMQTAKNLMDEVSKIIRVVKPDMKLFIGDSLSGNDTISQSKEFFQYTNFDGAILTKADADAKGGAAISIVYITSKPIVYLGVGQGYDNIITFDPVKFLESIFGNSSIIDNGNITTTTVYEPIAESRSPVHISEIEVQKPEAVRTTDRLGDYAKTTTASKEEEQLQSTPRISTSAMMSKASNNSEPTPIIVPKTEKNLKPLEKHHPSEPISTQTPPTVNENQPLEVEKKIRSRFSGLFSRKNKDKKTRIKDEDEEKETKLRKSAEDEKRIGGKEPKKHEEGEQQQGKDDVVYLTDDDIDDLLK